jgi:hypothetical protein
MRNIITITLLFLSTLVSAQKIQLQEIDETQTAIVSIETGKTLSIEKQTNDKRIFGYGNDFYVVFVYSTNKIYVKSPEGKVISGMSVPEGSYFEVINFGNMSDVEIFTVIDINLAFTITGEDDIPKRYNKHCKFIGNW